MKGPDLNKGPVLILGARSDIGRAIAHEFAALGHPLQLAARNAASLEADRADLSLRYGIEVSLHEFDVLAVETHPDFVARLPELPMVAICVVGLMEPQSLCEQESDVALRVMRSNYEGPASILAALANAFAARGSGTLVGVSSVAGERGRAVNYVYGSAKAGFTAFLSGLRNRLAKEGGHVVTVLPGFVETRMTEGMALPPHLTAQPKEVAQAILQAVTRGQDVIYVRRIWRLIMGLIRLIPERVFKWMRL